jgi:hypothetical protein
VCARVAQSTGRGGLDEGGEMIVGHGTPGSPNLLCPLDDLGRNLDQLSSSLRVSSGLTRSRPDARFFFRSCEIVGPSPQNSLTRSVGHHAK